MDLAGSGSCLAVFVAIEKNVVYTVVMIWIRRGQLITVRIR
jgi:hypothetical protein